jgi:hypothetical protein
MFLDFQPRTVRNLRKRKWHNSGIVTSSLWISHGGGVDARSNPVIVSKTTFEYRRPVSGPSCRSSDCRKYLHPRSEAVPTQDVTLSVSNQSVVSSDLSHKSNDTRTSKKSKRPTKLPLGYDSAADIVSSDGRTDRSSRLREYER